MRVASQLGPLSPWAVKGWGALRGFGVLGLGFRFSGFRLQVAEQKVMTR